MLTRLPASEARRSLGVRTAPDGNNKQQVEYMWSIAEEWRDKIRTGHLTHYEAWTALTTRVMKTLLYAVPAMNLTKKQSEYIMAPILDEWLLMLMGMQKYMPRECYRQSQTGKLARMSLEAMKVEIGVAGPVLSQSFRHLGILATNGFVKHTWQFLAENGFTIEDQVGDLKLRSQGDEFLTAAFVRHGIKGKALLRMNMCRLYLQVDSVSDITTADGRYITWAAQHGRRDHTLPQYHRWPTPGERVWENGGRLWPLSFVEATWSEVFCGHWGRGWTKHQRIGSGGFPSQRNGCIASAGSGSFTQFNAKVDEQGGSDDFSLEAWWSWMRFPCGFDGHRSTGCDRIL